VLGWLLVAGLVGFKISFPPAVNVRFVSINLPYWSLIVPALVGVWIFVAVCRWFCRSLRFSDGVTADFSGRGIEILHWWILWVLAGQHWKSPWLEIAGYVLGFWSTVHILRWFVRSVKLSSGRRFVFRGTFGELLAWEVSLGLSVITILGWAWVLAAFYRWLAEKTQSDEAWLQFHGRGEQILWRTLATILFCIPVVTIPWALLWYVRWLVQQFTLEGHFGSANATILDPDGASFLPPPQTMTTYSRPLNS